MSKSIIDKSNKLWKWSKPNKATRDWYKKTYGLEMKEIGMTTNEGFDLYIDLLTKKESHEE